MTTLKSVPGSEMFFQVVRKRIATTLQPLNKTGWCFENQPCKVSSFDQWIAQASLLPKAPGTLVFFLLNKNKELMLLKTLNAPNNLQRAFYSITNLEHLELIWGHVEDGTCQVMVQLAKAS